MSIVSKIQLNGVWTLARMSWGPCKRVSLFSFDAFLRELTLWYNTATPYNFHQPATGTYYGTQNPFQWLSNQFGCASNMSQETLNPYSGCFDPSLNASSSVYSTPIPAYNYGQNSVGYQYGHYPSGLTLTPADLHLATFQQFTRLTPLVCLGLMSGNG